MSNQEHDILAGMVAGPPPDDAPFVAALSDLVSTGVRELPANVLIHCLAFALGHTMGLASHGMQLFPDEVEAAVASTLAEVRAVVWDVLRRYDDGSLLGTDDVCTCEDV